MTGSLLLALWSRLSAFPSLMGTWIARNPVVLLVAALCLGLAYERHEAHTWQDRAEQCEAASKAAAKAQADLRTKERQDYEVKAHDADQSYRASLADVRSATADYLRTHRVRPARGVSPAQPFRETSAASVREDVPGTAVLVAEPDVQRCADWQAYGVALHDWALSVGE